MIKKYIGITLVTASMMVMGCSSNDDDATDTTTDGTTTSETTDGDTTDGDTTDGDTTDGDTTDGDTTDGDTTDGDTTDGDTTDGDTTDGDTTDGDTTDGDTTDGDTTDGDTTDGDTTDGDGTEWGNSVMGIIAAQPDLTAVEAAILAATGGLDQTLNDANNLWTMFAPIDTAVGDTVLDRDALLGHIHSGNQNVQSLTGLVGNTLSTTGGASQAITMTADGTLQIGGVNIIETEIVGDNGIVHKIDGILQ